MSVAVGTSGRAIDMLWIHVRLAVAMEGVQILLLTIYHLAFQCQRKFLDGRGGDYFRRDGRQTGLLDLVHVPSAFAAADGDDLAVEIADRHVDGEFRIRVKLFRPSRT